MTEHAKTKDEGRSIPVGIGTAILLFGFILQFFSVRQSLPIEIQFVSALFIAATAFLFIVWVWYRPIARYWTEKRLAGRENRISRGSVGALKSHIERLQTFANGQRLDTPVYPLNTLKGQGGEFSKIPEFYPWTRDVDNLCGQLIGLLGWIEVDRITFPWVVDTFSLVVSMVCNNLCRAVNEARLISEQNPIPKGIREDYNDHRNSFIRFLDDYTALVADLSKRFRSYEHTIPLTDGQSTTITHYAFHAFYPEKPKEL